eukprot:3398718-Ditylum_brightwellii.AAC.1
MSSTYKLMYMGVSWTSFQAVEGLLEEKVVIFGVRKQPGGGLRTYFLFGDRDDWQNAWETSA